MSSHLPYLHTRYSTLLGLLTEAAVVREVQGSSVERRRLVERWLEYRDHFSPSAVLLGAGDVGAAAQLTALCSNPDYSPSLWHLAQMDFARGQA